MTNLIIQHEQLKKQQERIDKELAALEQNDAFKKDMACKHAIEKALKDHGKAIDDLPRLFPQTVPTEPKAKSTRTKKLPKTKRPLYRYTHPKTGDYVDSRGLNNKTLQAWAKEHSLEVVKGWGVKIEDGESFADSPDEPSKGQEATAK